MDLFKFSIFLTLQVVCIHLAQAQSELVINSRMKSDFTAQVKSIDEFICRFNGIESNSEISPDSASRQNNIIALFNYGIDRGNMTEDGFKNMVFDFVGQVLESGVELKVPGGGMWVEANGSFSHEGRNYPMTVIMRSEIMKNGEERWAIAGVRGLAAAGVIDTLKYYSINPLEHELNFMAFDTTLLNNPSKAFGYRSKNAKIDELSVFLAFVSAGKIKPGIINNFTVHFMDVPGFIFTLNRFSRPGSNSGWLISSLKKSTEEEKQQYLNNLLNL